LTSEERDSLSSTCPYFPASYLDFLASIHLKPEEQVRLRFIPKEEDSELGEMGTIDCEIEGLWRETILYEVPLLAISKLLVLSEANTADESVSEAYFKFVDTDWKLDTHQIVGESSETSKVPGNGRA
jgi:nicotinate phosphoribosyltransferase